MVRAAARLTIGFGVIGGFGAVVLAMFTWPVIGTCALALTAAVGITAIAWCIGDWMIK